IALALLVVPFVGRLLVAGAQDDPAAGATAAHTAAQPTSMIYRGWQIEPFGPVGWKAIDGGIDLESTTAAGGLFFRQALGPGTSYRLTIEGKPIVGQTTIRLTIDGANPQWLPAPEGERTLAF